MSATPSSPPPREPAQDLARLSEQLLELHRLAREVHAADFLDRAVQSLRGLLGFRAAWWGLAVDADPDGVPAIYQSQALDLPEEYTAAWLALAERDEFGRAIRTQRGVVQRASEADADWGADITAFDRRFGIEHAMGLALEDASTGHGFFACLYRGPDQPAFGDADAQAFALLVRQALQLWRFGLQDALRAASLAELDRVAVAERDSGRLLHVGAQLYERLRARWPGWDGRRLPQGLRQAPSAGLRIDEQGGHVWLMLDEEAERSTPAPRLSPRRQQAARLFAQGYSNKEIARELALTPATVRTYLRDAYLQLAVRNKVQLGAALGL